MPLEQLLLLAIIQGLTEFLPISSSAHLILLPMLTRFEDQGVVIDVAVHIGSLGAVVAYFNRDLARLIKALPSFFRRVPSFETRLIKFLIIGSIPAVLFGALVGLTGWNDRMRSLDVIAYASIFFGIVLYASDRWGSHTRSTEDLTLRDVIVIGLAQALAIIPGTSRSGITMTAARALSLTRTEAARFSMLLSIPIILASGTFAALDLGSEAAGTNWGDALVSAVLSFVAALSSIAIFMKLVERIGFTPFVVYRIALGVALLTLF
jgi:undecaprenyl-diphosphatase